jgi:surface antigen
MTAKKKLFTVSEAEQIELEYKQLQIEELKEKIEARKHRRDAEEHRRAQQLADYEKNERQRLHRQRICKHRKGGKDNKFANGNSSDYAVVTNTFPNGDQFVMCTRCGKEVWKPKRELKKKDPAEYARQWAEWEKWRDLPTDNTPSGGQIFEFVKDAA